MKRPALQRLCGAVRTSHHLTRCTPACASNTLRLDTVVWGLRPTRPSFGAECHGSIGKKLQKKLIQQVEFIMHRTVRVSPCEVLVLPRLRQWIIQETPRGSAETPSTVWDTEYSIPSLALHRNHLHGQDHPIHLDGFLRKNKVCIDRPASKVSSHLLHRRSDRDLWVSRGRNDMCAGSCSRIFGRLAGRLPPR